MDIFIGILILSAIGFGIYFILHLLISYLTKDSTIDGIFNWFRVINRKIYEKRVKKIKNHPKVKKALNDFIESYDKTQRVGYETTSLAEAEQLMKIFDKGDGKYIAKFMRDCKKYNPKLYNRLKEEGY